jgi:uncharacterized protein
MKPGLLFLLLPLILVSVHAQEIRINGFINDYAGVIPQEYQSKIMPVLQSLYDSNTAQFSIVTINSLDGSDIESYALNLAQGNLGDSEKNNGLLLLVAVDDRKYRFEVGRGLEPILNDAKIGRIGRDYLVDNFRNNDYGEGIYEAVLAVQATLGGETDSSYYVSDAPTFPIPSVFIFFLVWFLIIGLVAARRRRYYRTHKHKDDYFGAALMAAWLFGPRGRGGIGGFGGGGFGGGFGGFGGGGFGGGGASGGW